MAQKSLLNNSARKRRAPIKLTQPPPHRWSLAEGTRIVVQEIIAFPLHFQKCSIIIEFYAHQQLFVTSHPKCTKPVKLYGDCSAVNREKTII
mmetsp:Transcript_33700/g.66591  ORF Transcript_33700/g.66591 Transcript_33700/m.66591 type:complete len:92 (+) Transcript_33700:1014-1289(+)